MSYVIKIKSQYFNDVSSKKISIPAIFTESGLLISHARYLAHNSKKSASWRERAVFAVMLLITFINANTGRFGKASELLRAFTNALTEGTIDFETLEDASGLYWSARRLDDARILLLHITSYTDWLIKQEGYDGQRINKFREATSTECRLNWCAYYHKKNGVFLSHLMGGTLELDKHKFVREIRTPQVPVVEREMVPRFPEEMIGDLIRKGFVRSLVSADAPDYLKMDYKGQAITLLMHYGGLRKSEALHIYVEDILIDEVRGEAVVRVYHPSAGKSPDEMFRTRREYLAKKFRLKPRTEYHRTERLHLGWKDPLLTDTSGCFKVFFFPPDKAMEFLLTWANYLKHQRVPPPAGFEHPYAFTNSVGNPETLKNFQRLHTAAVSRIGLISKKYLGTTEHGHRHSYGYRLSENGFGQIDIQKSLHHKDPQSSYVYTQPTSEDLREKMKRTE